MSEPTDSERLDWLQHQVTCAYFYRISPHHAQGAVRLFTVESQHVHGNTVREALEPPEPAKNDDDQ